MGGSGANVNRVEGNPYVNMGGSDTFVDPVEENPSANMGGVAKIVDPAVENPSVSMEESEATARPAELLFVSTAKGVVGASPAVAAHCASTTENAGDARFVVGPGSATTEDCAQTVRNAEGREYVSPTQRPCAARSATRSTTATVSGASATSSPTRRSPRTFASRSVSWWISSVRHFPP